MDSSNPAPLIELTFASYRTHTVAAAVELDVFSLLAGGQSLSAADLATKLGLAQRPTDLLLTAGAALGLFDKTGDRYRNSALAEEFLVAGQPSYLGGYIRMVGRLAPAIGGALRGERPGSFEAPRAEPNQSPGSGVAGYLHTLSTFTGRSLADAYDFGRHARLLDIGGGSGAVPIELCRRYPDLTGTVLDLPHVCEIASAKIGEAGLAERIGTAPGDFLADAPLPGGYDAMLLSSILHNWSEQTNRELLAKCHAALQPGGVVVICDLLLDADRTGPPEAALMGMIMLIATENGQSYGVAEHARWLGDAGFTDVRHVPLQTGGGANGAVIAHKAP
jgi:SAM-dependent methyltransferase